MGEMADFANDAIMVDGEMLLDYHLGKMTPQEAYEAGVLNEHGGLVGTEGISSKTCRCCGKKGLRWGKKSGKWRLFHGKQIHDCPTNKLVERK